MTNLKLSLDPLSASSGGVGVAPMKPKRMKRKPNPNPTRNPNPSTHKSIFKTNTVSPCSECGKQFNTWKALFGHMRCHPERQWRGMNKKSKLKQIEQERAHDTDEVTNAALILMQISAGWSFKEMLQYIESHRESKMRNLWIDLNLPPPVEED